MALPGETIGRGAPILCGGCKTRVTDFGVYKSGAGWYIGTYCGCGPYTRESVEYWRTETEAEQALETGMWTAR